MKESDKEARKDLTEDCRRLTKMVLANMQEALQNRTIDQKEIRLLSSAAIRSIRLLRSMLDDEPDPRDATVAGKE